MYSNIIQTHMHKGSPRCLAHFFGIFSTNENTCNPVLLFLFLVLFLFYISLRFKKARGETNQIWRSANRMSVSQGCWTGCQKFFLKPVLKVLYVIWAHFQNRSWAWAGSNSGFTSTKPKKVQGTRLKNVFVFYCEETHLMQQYKFDFTQESAVLKTERYFGNKYSSVW